MEPPPVFGDGTNYLNAIARALGTIPAESLVLLPLAAGRSRVVLRFDLPPVGSDNDIAAYASTVLGYAMRLPDADGLIAAIFTQASAYGDEPPFQVLADALAHACTHAGIPLRAAVWQARDGRGQFGGRQELGPSDEVTIVPMRDINAMLQIAPAPPSQRARVRRRVEEIGHTPFQASVFTEIWRALASESGNANAPLVQTAREELFAISAISLSQIDGVGHCTVRAAFSLLNEDDLERFGIAVHEAEGYAFATADLTSISVRSGEPIDRLGMAVTSALLRELVSLTESRWHAGPFAALAWLAWARGESSAACWYAEHSLAAGDDESPHALANLVADLCRSGVVPSWFGATGCDPGPPPRRSVRQPHDAHWSVS